MKLRLGLKTIGKIHLRPLGAMGILISILATEGCRTLNQKSRPMDSRTNSSFFVDRSIWQLLVTAKDSSGVCNVSNRSAHTTFAGIVVAKDSQSLNTEFYFVSGSSSSLPEYDGSKYCGVLRQSSSAETKDYEIELKTNYVSLKNDMSVFTLNPKSTLNLSWKGEVVHSQADTIEAGSSVVLNNAIENSNQIQGQVSSLNSTRVSLGRQDVHEVSWNRTTDLNILTVGQAVYSQNQFVGILGSAAVGLQEGRPAVQCLVGSKNSCVSLTQNSVLVPGGLIVKTLQAMSNELMTVPHPRLRVQSHLPTEILVAGARLWEVKCLEEGSCKVQFERSSQGNETLIPNQSSWSTQFQSDLQKFFRELPSGEVKIAFCQDGERKLANILEVATAIQDQCRIKLDAVSETDSPRRSSDEWTLLAQGYKEEQETLKSDIAMVWQKVAEAKRAAVYQSLSLQGRKVLFEAVEQKSANRANADQMYNFFENDARAIAAEWKALPQADKASGWITKNITERIFMFNGVGDSPEVNIMNQLDQRFPRFADDLVREYLKPDSFRGEIGKVFTAPWKRQAVFTAENGVTKGVVNFTQPDRENRWLKIDVPVSCAAAKWKFQAGTLVESTRALDLGHYLVEKSRDMLTYYFRVVGGKMREDEKDLFAVAQVFFQRAAGQGPCQVVLSTSNSEIFVQNFEVGKILRATDEEIKPHESVMTCVACALRKENVVQELYGLIDRGLIVDLNMWASMLRASK